MICTGDDSCPKGWHFVDGVHTAGFVGSVHPAPRTHTTTVTADDLGLRYYAKCTCGWDTYGQMSRTDAMRLTKAHTRLTKPRRP